MTYLNPQASTPPAARRASSPTLSRRLGLMLAALLMTVAASAVMAQKATPSATGISKTAYLGEVRAQLLKARVTAVNADAIVAALGRLNMTEIVELTDVTKAGQLERLLPGTAISKPPPANAVDAARGSAGSTGPASQQALQGARDTRGGFRDTRGQASSTCQACGGGFIGSASGQNPNDGDARTFTTQSGVVISIYGDNSVKIQGTDGKVEYLNSDGRLVDRSNRPVTPNPEAERPLGAVTLADIRGLEARFGRNVTPTGESRSSGGGGTAPTRTETLGLFADERVAGRASISQLQEIMRVAAEKLGPKVGR